MAFANRFGWSVSREATFDECPRRYYYHYYGSWEGWRSDAPPLAREAFRLKRLVSRPLWRGQLVHYVATFVLRSMRKKGAIPETSKVVAYTLDRFDRQLEFSRERRYLTTPKKTGNRLNPDWLALFEHEYERPLSAAALERTRAECVAGIEGLLASPLLCALLETDSSRWEIEDLESGAFSQQFAHRGVPVHVKTDFMFRDRGGARHIVDWKTNRPARRAPDPLPEDLDDPASDEAPRAAEAQLGVYGYWAARILGEPLATLRLAEVRLLEGGRVIEHRIDEETVSRADERISRGIAKLAAMLVGGNEKRNEPLPPADFAPARSGRCAFCNFSRICEAADAAPPGTPTLFPL